MAAPNPPKTKNGEEMPKWSETYPAKRETKAPEIIDTLAAKLKAWD